LAPEEEKLREGADELRKWSIGRKDGQTAVMCMHPFQLSGAESFPQHTERLHIGSPELREKIDGYTRFSPHPS
jgi:hypothetical protein